MSEFSIMLADAIAHSDLNQKEAAKEIGISQTYLSDLLNLNRAPSVEVTNKVCRWLAAKQNKELFTILSKWHNAGAKANGWII